MTTGNSDMTAKTGNSYATGTTTISVEITTETQVFLSEFEESAPKWL